MSKPVSATIEFAKRHLVTEASTFNAWSAIARFENLIEDIQAVAPVLTPHLEAGMYPRFFEFTSYYRVGFVTALEWHAKSRLYDMFSFDPTKIDAHDIQQAAAANKLPQMLAENLTVPHLIAGALSVSSKESYVTAIDRVFAAVGAPKSSLSDILSVKEHDVSLGQELERLYSDRNNLVHEIGIQTIGHPNIRDFDTFDDALSLGMKLIGMMREIERLITKYAPQTFPNRLGDDGYPVNEEEILLKLISDAEAKIEQALGNNDDIGVGTDVWRKEVDLNGTALRQSLEFVDSLRLPGFRYYDVRPHLTQNLLKQRVSFLALLAEQIPLEAEDESDPGACDG